MGTLGVVDLAPSDTRPLSGKPDGSGDVSSNREDVILGRSRGDFCSTSDSWCAQLSPSQLGKYHGHITILSLFGNEVLAVDTNESQSHTGPLDSLQTQLLDQVCSGSGGGLCVNVLTADSTTCGPTSPTTPGAACDPANLEKYYGVPAQSGQTVVGSLNHFAVANAAIGANVAIVPGTPAIVVRIGCPNGTGPSGILACAANSWGNIYLSNGQPFVNHNPGQGSLGNPGNLKFSPDASGGCQASQGASRIADVNAAGTAVATVVTAETDVTACNSTVANPPPTRLESGQVLGLGGSALALPVVAPAGCSSGGNATNDPSKPGDPNIGTPNTDAGIPALLPIICNANDPGTGVPTGASPADGIPPQISDSTIPYDVREALNLCLIDATGPCVGQYVAKVTLSAAEAAAQAPPGPSAPTTTTTTGPSAPTTTGPPSGVTTAPSAPTTTGVPAPKAPTGAAAPPSKEVVPTKAVTPSLPFTGYDALSALLLGLVALGSGLGLRHAVKRRSGAS
jgi:hypothetical protein